MDTFVEMMCHGTAAWSEYSSPFSLLHPLLCQAYFKTGITAPRVERPQGFEPQQQREDESESRNAAT